MENISDNIPNERVYLLDVVCAFKLFQLVLYFLLRGMDLVYKNQLCVSDQFFRHFYREKTFLISLSNMNFPREAAWQFAVETVAI